MAASPSGKHPRSLLAASPPHPSFSPPHRGGCVRPLAAAAAVTRGRPG